MGSEASDPLQDGQEGLELRPASAVDIVSLKPVYTTQNLITTNKQIKKSQLCNV